MAWHTSLQLGNALSQESAYVALRCAQLNMPGQCDVAPHATMLPSGLLSLSLRLLNVAVRLSVRPSVCPSVRPSVLLYEAALLCELPPFFILQGD